MQPTLMTSAVIHGPGEVRRVRIPRPSFGPGHVLFRVEGTGVCASNLGPWKGLPWLTYPLAPGAGGHEAWGIVEDAADDVTAISKGDRIAALSYHAFADYDVARASDSLVIPATLGDKPFPGEAVACAMNIAARSSFRSGETVAIVGVGFLGAILTRLAKKAGARVIAVTRRHSSLALARRWGADELVEMRDYSAVVDAVKQITGGAQCHCVVEAVGNQLALDLSSELVAERGRLVIAGYHQDGPRQVKMQLWNWRGIDVVNAHERDSKVYMDGMRRGLAAVLEGDIDLEPLLTHRFPLGELATALDGTRDKPGGFIKAVVQP